MQPAVINIFEKAAKKAGKILIRDFGEVENLHLGSGAPLLYYESRYAQLEQTE